MSTLYGTRFVIPKLNLTILKEYNGVIEYLKDVLGSQLCFEDIKVGFKILSVNFLPNKYFQQMLDNVGINLPNYKLRNWTEDLTTTSSLQSNGLTKSEFESLCHKLTKEDVRRTFKTSKQHDRSVVSRIVTFD